MNLTKLISDTLSLRLSQIDNVVKLIFEDGATIPFVSRYRKEMTGGLDEVAIEKIKEMYTSLCELEKRKEYVLTTIRGQELLTEELENKITNCFDIIELEDIYLPYKPKRRTKATIARESGLEPLANSILKGGQNIESLSERFLTDKVLDSKAALQGAMDIIAEIVSEDMSVRNIVRNEYNRNSVISSKVIKGKEEEAIKYSDYFNFSEPVKRCASHRTLAMIRAENEGFLRLSLSIERLENIIKQITYIYNKPNSQYIKTAVEDGYKRLIKPSIETEIMSQMKERADKQAIEVFCSNLRQLLLAPPLGQKAILAIDPGFRTGCKVVCLNANGDLVHNETIYPHAPQNQDQMAMKKISTLVETYKIDAISIGNGTASRETESFIKRIHFNKDINIFVISEDGASVYSASSVAREEFPAHDVTVRGAVSIGRRLMDPLSELVKIDPKSIGVGQYQHDVDQTKLKNALNTVVESCVNSVGINLNTTSKHLLTYISGIGPAMAASIVEYRKENGNFNTRKELMNVPRLGKKVFEQCAGFLRITGDINPLDNSAVHPESYHIVEKMAKDIGVKVKDLIRNEQLISTIDINRYTDPANNIGIPTLSDIINELKKPGLDPRQQIKIFEFDNSIKTIADVKEGMILPGIVNNITNFGAFVDIGIKQGGLIHISQVADSFVSDINSVLSIHQHVTVKVLSVDMERSRIQLTLKI